MSLVFEHTFYERGSWRGWLRDGQTLEISWPRASLGLRVVIHSDDSGSCRMFWIGLGLIQFFIPLGRIEKEYPVGDEPSWGFDLSREFGIVWHWKHVYKSWRWPFHRILLDHSYATVDGGWKGADDWWRKGEERHKDALAETHPYRYVLRSGEVQDRKATIIEERWTHGRHILSRLGWPSQVKHSIYVEFDGEVGEESGSWKGGTIGCGYDMLPGEEPVDTLRRMEREREF